MEIGTWDAGPDLSGEAMFLCVMGEPEEEMIRDLTGLLESGEMRWLLWLIPETPWGGFR